MLPFIPPQVQLTIQEQHEYMHSYENACLRLQKWYEAEPNQSKKVFLLSFYLDALAADLLFGACAGESRAMLSHLEAINNGIVTITSQAVDEVTQLLKMMMDFYSKASIVCNVQDEYDFFDRSVQALRDLSEREPDSERKALLVSMHNDSCLARTLFNPETGEGIAFQGMLRSLLWPDFPITPQTADKIHHLLMHVIYKHCGVSPPKLRTKAEFGIFLGRG